MVDVEYRHREDAGSWSDSNEDALAALRTVQDLAQTEFPLDLRRLLLRCR